MQLKTVSDAINPITPSNWSEVVLSFRNYSFTSRLLYYQILILKVKAKVAILFLSFHRLKQNSLPLHVRLAPWYIL